jgi:hypothetical protein
VRRVLISEEVVGDALERIKESEVLVHCEVRVETRLGRTDTNKFLDFKGF